jgi:hypothetical protein
MILAIVKENTMTRSRVQVGGSLSTNIYIDGVAPTNFVSKGINNAIASAQKRVSGTNESNTDSGVQQSNNYTESKKLYT